jgi:hypothetical protein
MSRTYRTRLDLLYKAKGRFWTSEERSADIADNSVSRWEQLLRGDFNWGMVYVLNNRCRDGKAWDKPNKEFKQMKRRCERRLVNQAVYLGKDIPVFKKSDQWDWT